MPWMPGHWTTLPAPLPPSSAPGLSPVLEAQLRRQALQCSHLHGLRPSLAAALQGPMMMPACGGPAPGTSATTQPPMQIPWSVSVPCKAPPAMTAPDTSALQHRCSRPCLPPAPRPTRHPQQLLRPRHPPAKANQHMAASLPSRRHSLRRWTRSQWAVHARPSGLCSTC